MSSTRTLPLALLACIAVTSAAHAQMPDTSLWVTDGGVDRMVRVGNTLYVGGTFTRVGPHIGAAVPFDATTGQPRSPFARIPGNVNAVVADGAGGWYVGGRFVGVSGAPRKNLVHLLANGSLSAWAPDPDSEVYALALSGSTLYVGGRFEHMGGQGRYKIGAVDVSSGLATAFDPHPPLIAVNSWPRVNSLAVANGVVYAGGFFFTIGGQPRNHFAALDPVTGAATGWNPQSNGPVLAIASTGSTLYVGGFFTTIGGAARFQLAELDATTSSATAWDPHPDAVVDCMLLTASKLYIGGAFSTVTGTGRHGAAAFDRATGLLTAFDPAATIAGGYPGVVHGLALAGSTVYAAGEFTSIGGQPRRYLAALDATTGAASNWNADVNAPALVVAVTGGSVFAGGNFWTAGGVPRGNLAAFDLATGHPTAWAPVANDRVVGMATDGTVLYIGGYFSLVQGLAHPYIAKLDLASGAVATWDPNANSVAWDLKLAGATLYAAGYFTSMGGVSHTTVAAIDAASGATLPWNPITQGGPANAIVPDLVHNAVLVASQGGMWRFRASDGATLWTATFDPSGVPGSLLLTGSTLYVGGRFATLNGQPRSNLAAMDAVSGVVQPWAADPNGVAWPLATEGSRVYVGGVFTGIGEQARTGFAVLNVTNAAVDIYDARLSGSVNSMALAGASMFLSGSFTSCANFAAPGFLKLASPPPLGVPPVVVGSALAMSVDPMPVVALTQLRFMLPATGRVWLDVLDLAGRRVESLLSGAELAAGVGSRTLDTHAWKPGVYLVRLRTPAASVTRRIVVER